MLGFFGTHNPYQIEYDVPKFYNPPFKSFSPENFKYTPINYPIKHGY